jgi:hypothetical protein
MGAEENMEKKCNNCGAENKNTNVPFVVYQATAARQERQIKRMWIVVLVLIVALIASNIAWIIYNSRFETVEMTTEEYYDVEQNADGNGNNNSIINGGVINGEAENKVYEENNDKDS